MKPGERIVECGQCGAERVTHDYERDADRQGWLIDVDYDDQAERAVETVRCGECRRHPFRDVSDRYADEREDALEDQREHSREND